MVDWEQVDRTGRELRELGHRRAELVRRIRDLEAAGRKERCVELTDELEAISLQCQELLSRQHGILAAAFPSPGLGPGAQAGDGFATPERVTS